MIMECIRCECMLTTDFAPLDEAGAYSLCESCFEAYMQERGVPFEVEIEHDGVPAQPIPAP